MSERAEAAEPLKQDETTNAAWNPPHPTERLLIKCEEQLGSRADSDVSPDPVLSNTTHANHQISRGVAVMPPKRSQKEVKRMLKTAIPQTELPFSAQIRLKLWQSRQTKRLSIQRAPQKQAVQTYHLIGISVGVERVLTDVQSKIKSGPPCACWQSCSPLVKSALNNEGPPGSVARQRKGALCTENNPSI